MREFLEPELKKFILPVILIILFLVVMDGFYAFGHVMDEYGCEMISLLKEARADIGRNDTAAFNRTDAKMAILSENLRVDMKQIQNMEPVIGLVKVVDPFIPFPCEGILGYGRVCEFYISKDTFDCYISLRYENEISLFTLPEDYIAASPISLAWNVLFLFVEGYMASSAILFVYRKTRNR